MIVRFEKIPSPVYPAYLCVGDYSIALAPELIESLKEAAKGDPARFTETLLQTVGSNRYLKEMIQKGLSKAEDQALLARRLQEEIQKL